MVEQFPGKARFVSENFGASKLAERFGVTRYPAVFVNDVLVARPRDFGFFGEGDSAGRYAPWRNAENQERFKKDLAAMVARAVAGKSPAQASIPTPEDRLARLPELRLTDLAGKRFAPEQLAGRVVVVEFWATWCPPCGSTLAWLGELRQRYGDRLEVVALAVESPADQVKTRVAAQSREIRWAIADAPTAAAFGDVVAVPTLFVFDRAGAAAGVYYGAPPELHGEVETLLARLLK